MQLLTATGDLRQVSSRAFPIAGIDSHQMRSPSSSAIPLGRLPSGETRMLAISRIYRTNPVLYAIINLIARNLSSIPIRTYSADSDGERSRFRSDLPAAGPGRPAAGIALDSLARHPAPRLSKRKLVFRTVHDIAVFGNAIAAFNWGDYGPNELWPIPWRRTVVGLTDPMTIDRFDVWGATGRVTLDPEHVIHWSWGDDPESPIGVSPIESLQYTIALHNAIDRHLVSYYGNAARPSGIMKIDKMPSQADVDLLREQFKQLYTAPESAGNVVLTSGDYTPIAEATGVPTLVELIKLSREEMAGVYGVDPPMFGVLQNAIKANMQEGREKFVMDTLGPWATLWEDEANTQMVWQNPLWNYCWWEFDLEQRMRPDLAARAAIYANMATVLTPNEKRRRENLPRLPYPEADTVWFGSGTGPLGFGIPTTTSDITPDVEPGADPVDPEDPDDEDEDPDDGDGV